MTDADHLEEVYRYWSAAAVTEATDKVTGVTRTKVLDGAEYSLVDYLDAYAVYHSGFVQSHPLDPHVGRENNRWLKLVQPGDSWWVGGSNAREGRIARTVVLGLSLIRKGWRPTFVTRSVREGKMVAAPDLETHQREAAELRVNHFCRLAEVPIL